MGKITRENDQIISTTTKMQEHNNRRGFYRLKDSQIYHPIVVCGLYLDSDFEKVKRKNLGLYEVIRTWNNNQVFNSNII